MTTGIKTGEQYTIRRKFLTLTGKSFHIHDQEGRVVGFCRQKAFKLREDIRLYTDESQSELLMTLKARQVIDFGATYDVADRDGRTVGSLRRKGFTSLVRDAWLVFDPEGQQIGHIHEDSAGLAIMRRVIGAISLIVPQVFHLKTTDGRHIARFRTNRNPFVHRLSVATLQDDARLDASMVIAAGLLLMAIEGRQS